MSAEATSWALLFDSKEKAEHASGVLWLNGWAGRAPVAMPPAQNWQPIDTRPDRGSMDTYLVANAQRGDVAPLVRGVIQNNVGTAFDWAYGEAITHWMPLPPPPAA